MAITAKGRATRERIVAGAADHLRRDDPADVTLDDILAATRTSKGQLFHYFPGGKPELLLAVAHHEAERVLDDQEPHLSALTSWSAWESWRDTVVARYRAQGSHCPLAALMTQVRASPGSDEVAAVLLAQWHARLADGVRSLRTQGLVRASADPDAIASAFVAAIQGGVQILRATGDIRHLEAALDVLLADLHRP
ncbi:TetR/AcrR family transcriptional regulator [Tsukamurella pseudospumae]|uniref:TetR family transcriptional regulator n=1 Tax=Tsukamurella pseudospumae TaxID=239498 RepID=A0A137YYU2_9ACTN|nr:TetR/AcrR family transcriptional regulator [Tsukamurella pseudospumae]KXO91115.1 TetR family transcriptional regulator [Tsukamurella pseudospumae]